MDQSWTVEYHLNCLQFFIVASIIGNCESTYCLSVQEILRRIICCGNLSSYSTVYKNCQQNRLRMLHCHQKWLISFISRFIPLIFANLKCYHRFVLVSHYCFISVTLVINIIWWIFMYLFHFKQIFSFRVSYKFVS